jgi:ATP-dependent Clp protease protease subunit
MKLLFLLTVVNGRNIVLTDKNTVSLTDEVNDQSVSSAINGLYDKIEVQGEKNIYLYLNTPGGSVNAGNRLIETIEYLRHRANISCIAHDIASMGFVILQACPYRLGLKTSKIMQHQISTMLYDEKQRLKTYMKYMDDLERELIELQSNRMNISYNKFVKETYHNWWLTGKTAYKNNVIDEIVSVGCDSSLLKLDVVADVLSNGTMLYSKCPLIYKPVSISYI